MGTCGSVAGRGDCHGRPRVVPKPQSAQQQPPADGPGQGAAAAGTDAADCDDEDDAASSQDAEDSGSDSEQSDGSGSGDDAAAQSLFGPVPPKRRRRGRHRRNKSRHAHKKAQRQLEERMRRLKTDDLTEPDQADVIHSPSAAASSQQQQQQQAAGSVDTTVSDSASPSSQLAAGSQLRLPARSRAAGASSHAASSLPGGLFPFDPEEVSILLIDGDAEVMRSIEEWLASCRYSVIACEEGREAIEVLLEAGAREDSGRAAGKQQQQQQQQEQQRGHSVSSPISSPSSLSPASSSSPQQSQCASGADECDIDMIVCDWSVSVGSQTFLDWVMDNPSLSHIPVIILCDDETTAQGMDRLLRRGAADIIRKPLLHHPFLHSLQTIINNRVEQQHAQLLKTRGDQYKQELNRGKTGSLLSLPAPKRSLSSMLHTFVAASPRNAPAAAGSAFSPRHSQLAAAGVQQVHAVLVSADDAVHADVTAAVSLLPLTLHSCCSPSESLLLQEDIDAQSNTSSIIAQSGASASDLLSPHFPSHFAFSASTLSSPTSRTAGAFQHSQRSARVSIAEEQHTRSPVQAQRLPISPLLKKSSGIASAGTAPSSPFLTVGAAAQARSISPRPSSSVRPSIISLQPVTSYFGTELFILDAACMRGEEGREWMEIMKARSAKQQTPVLLLTPESDPSSQLVRELQPLSVSTISLPLSSSLLSKKLHLILDSVSIIRHQRLYAYRAQAYRALVKKMRENKDRERERTAAGAARSLRLVAHDSSHGDSGTAMPARQSVSATAAEPGRAQAGQSEEEAMRSLLSSPTGLLMKPSSRRPDGSPLLQDGSVAYLASRKASEVILQPFTSFPPPGFHSRHLSDSVSGRLWSARSTSTSSSRDRPDGDLSPPAAAATLSTSASSVKHLSPASPPACLPTSLSPTHDEPESPPTVRLPARDSPPLTTLERTLDTLVGLARLSSRSTDKEQTAAAAVNL